MLHIVVVEDEERIRMGLEKIIRKSERTNDEIQRFSNGHEAFNYILHTKPGEVDVLITDIKIPMMDGLKLIENVSKIRPEIHNVILSGFNDFEYASQIL